jgi:hypothetical protein
MKNRGEDNEEFTIRQIFVELFCRIFAISSLPLNSFVHLIQ